MKHDSQVPGPKTTSQQFFVTTLSNNNLFYTSSFINTNTKSLCSMNQRKVPQSFLSLLRYTPFPRRQVVFLHSGWVGY